MNLPKILFLALVGSAAIASAQIVNLPGTGAGSTPGATDPNWDVYHFSDKAGINVVTGTAGLSSYLTYANSGTAVELATAHDSTPYGSAWVAAPANNTWLSINTNASGNPIGDVNNSPSSSTTRFGGGYAFVFDLGAALVGKHIAFWEPVSLSLTLRGDNGFSAHLIAPDSFGQWTAGAELLGSTIQNFRSTDTAAVINFTGTLTRSTDLVVLLSNDAITSTNNPAGLLVTDFTAYNPVPEPSTYGAIAGLALVGFAVWSRRKRS